MNLFKLFQLAKKPMMDKCWIFVFVTFLFSCEEIKTSLTAQEIIDKSIEASGGTLYVKNDISFDFRGRHYSSKAIGKQKILKRHTRNDTVNILDVKSPKGFQRFVNDSPVIIADTMANAYANAVNSVHYFAYLPYGLNDRAVNKRLLGKTKIGPNTYYKIEITFDQDGGGDDYDDTYIYWFNTKTFSPDFLAYKFHVNGGGQRFREAYNERTVGGIRFVDYKNFKSDYLEVPIYQIDSLYQLDKLELLSEIKLEHINVNPGNYN
ncbi:DUF6503 family protein [Maribacter sp. 2304DJ31-5]|uniref:DUF6503 family protein n=1 Tax=Maribacter sp. 2304DJ31-5 TaxID=3386273 RepID=UPI0039BD650A